jgi:hypothetical protein
MDERRFIGDRLMTNSEFQNLKPGDIVRGKSSNELYMVTGNYGGRVTAVKTVDMTNPPEWELVKLETLQNILGKLNKVD